MDIKKYFKKENVLNVANFAMVLLLFISFVFALIMIIVAKNMSYALTAFQSVLGIVVLGFPYFMRKKLKLVLPFFMKVILVVFVYMAIFLGEVRHFYLLYGFWDVLLHTFSGMIFALLSLSIVSLLNNNNKGLQLSPIFVAIFAFCFSVTIGMLWEIFEFGVDSILGYNMQKFIPQVDALWNGGRSDLPLAGTAEQIAEFFRSPAGYKYALMDTMEDILVDALGALIVSIVGYFIIKKNKDFTKFTIVKEVSNLPTDPENVLTSVEEVKSLIENDK